MTAGFARQEIVRTAFFEEPNGEFVQSVLRTAACRTKCIELPDRAAAGHELKEIHTQQYNLLAGEAFKIVDYKCGHNHHLFIIACHRLTGDGSTTENPFAELSRLYSGAKLYQQASQYPDFALQQWKALDTGNMDADVSYWTSMYTIIPSAVRFGLGTDPAASVFLSPGLGSTYKCCPAECRFRFPHPRTSKKANSIS